MKSLYLFLFALFATTPSYYSQNVNIPDTNFKNALIVSGVDTNGDGNIQTSEAEAVTSLNVSLKEIVSFEGIEAFINLESLDISRNIIDSFDISGFPNLKTFNCYSNRLNSLNISGSNLTFLNIGGNQALGQDFIASNISLLSNLTVLKTAFNNLESIDVSSLTKLEELDVYSNSLSSLDVSNLTKLKKLYCQNNNLAELDVSQLIDLEELTCNHNNLNSLNIGSISKIVRLICNNNNLTTLDCSNLTSLDFLNCNYNLITNLDIVGLSNLQTIWCTNNEISELNIETLANLRTLKCSFNKLPSLDISSTGNLTSLDCDNNELTSFIADNESVALIRCHNNKLESLDFSNTKSLDHLECNDNLLTSLFIKNGINETTFNDSLVTIDFDNNPNLGYICCDAFEADTVQSLVDTYGYKDCEVSISCGASTEIINIPDANFKNILLTNGTDANSDGEIQVFEAEDLTLLAITNQDIESLEGIQYFVNLTTLSAFQNAISSVDLSQLTKLKSLSLAHNNLTEIDLSALTDLEYLYINNNSLTTLNVGGLTNLIQIDCSYNPLSSLNVTTLSKLENLNCSVGNNLATLEIGNLNNLRILICGHNKLTELDLSGVPNLTRLACNSNEITSLDFSNIPKMENLNCQLNPFTELDFSNLPELKYLTCGYSNLSSIDVTNCTKLERLVCGSIPSLTTLFLKNGSLLDQFYISGSSNISYICCDAFQVDAIQNEIDSRGYTCEINTYCSFKPGGDTATLDGIFYYNETDDACLDTNPLLKPIKYEIDNSGSRVVFISNSTGGYRTHLDMGEYTITPLLENPEYYKSTPSSYSTTIEENDLGTIINQDFCITPDGEQNDLEITMFPTSTARPGFDTSYKIIYKNKGNQTLSGSIDIHFEDTIMDLISATPAQDNLSENLLSWNYTNLEPLNSGEILITFNINTPQETPAVNDGDILKFVAVINPVTGDETESDNTFRLNQAVVNSFDPNDKTCLEGDTITPDLIGEYVHYLIRCENTGSAEAVNIVIRDIIDETRFDINTLTVTDSSHSMVTKIEGNNVEFIFENIYLPFDDANNDGYVAFKIKTLPTLQVGDIFENEAAIYFDYNAPIITNKYQTSIKTPLSTNIEEFEDQIDLFPNPIKNRIFITSKQPIQSISLFDIAGRPISKVSFTKYQSQMELNTEDLVVGTYFIKVKTDLGEIVKKVIKN